MNATETTTTKLLAYHNDPAVKASYQERVRQHQAADQVVQGYGYWKDGQGCAVGCTIHSGELASYETELGIPRAIARLEDGIFENLPVQNARRWPAEFLEAIPVGADLSGVKDQFLHWLLVDPTDGVIRFAQKEQTHRAIQAVADLYDRKIAGGNIEL